MNLTSIVENLTGWALNHGLRVVLIFVITFIFNKFIRSLIKNSFEKQIEETINQNNKKQRIKTIVDIIDDVTISAVWVIAILMILSELGVNTSPLLTALGAIGLAFGFAARGIAKDFLQGVFILLEDQFRIGDTVKVAGMEGKVIDLNPRTTILKTEDGKTHIIPNREIKIVSKKQ